MDQIEKINQAIQYINKKSSLQPEILIILGSGLGEFADHLENPISIPYHEIPNFSSKQVEGHSGTLVLGQLCGKNIVVMKGRGHYYQGFSDEEMRFPIQVIRSLGVKKMIVTNACGGMNPSFRPGDIMIINDHINMMGRNPLIGDNQAEFGSRFIDMSEPYDFQWINRIHEIAGKENIPVHIGIYVGYGGPSYETRSEIQAYRLLGGDVVGMSTIPEVIVAKHLGMKVLGISCITNMATGLQQELLSHQDVLEVSKKALSKITKLLLKFIESLE